MVDIRQHQSSLLAGDVSTVMTDVLASLTRHRLILGAFCGLQWTDQGSNASLEDTEPVRL